MEVTAENIEYCFQAIKVDFLTERWEREMYAKALMSAAAWGNKVDEENKHKKKYRLIDKYNV